MNYTTPTTPPNNVHADQQERSLIDDMLDMGNSAPTATPNASDTAYFLSESADDEGNAQCLHRLYANKFLHTAAYGWMYNTGKHWESQHGEKILERAIVDTLKQRRKAAVDAEKESIVKVTRPDAKRIQATKFNYSSIPAVLADAGDFDNSPYLLNCDNGVVDLRTGQLSPHGPDNRFAYCLPTQYDPTADTSEWHTFLAQVAPGAGMDEYLQQCVGYSITGDTREECLFYIHGPTRSGKGTFINAILEMLGGSSCPLARGTSFNTFTAKRDGDNQNFDLAPLKACRFVSASESDKFERMNEAKVKAITGNDPITASFKHKTPFTYIPQYKIWLVSNHPVNGDVDDDAFWNRVRVIEFPNSFAGTEDTTLKQRMCHPDNLRAVLAWAVEGARLWYAGKRLTTPATVKAATQAQRDKLDYVGQWLDECCERGQGWTATGAVYPNYERWCIANGVTQKKQKSLTEALQRKGLGYAIKKVEGKTIRVIEGISLL